MRSFSASSNREQSLSSKLGVAHLGRANFKVPRVEGNDIVPALAQITSEGTTVTITYEEAPSDDR